MKPDTKTHLLGGLAVLLFTAGVAALLLFGAQLHPLAVAVLIAGFVAGGAVEGTQAADNRLAKAAGLPLPHEVSLRDLVNTWLPCLVAAVLIEIAARQHWLPPLPG